jgi:aspartate carbamoyltransferase catalytic subunit
MPDGRSRTAEAPPVTPGRRRSGANSVGRRVEPGPLLAARGGRVDVDLLDGMTGRSLVHPRELDREHVVELCAAAALLETIEVRELHPLDGKIAITAFFEASTRTRLSFESAMLRLDGKVLSVPDGRTTGAAKGESLADIGQMFNGYGDVVIMRHTETESIEEIRESLTIPLVNAGNGSGHHPTQALVDWYALLKWRPELASADCPPDRRIHLGIVGTPGSMRAVKSFLWAATFFTGAVERITIVSELADPIGEGLQDAIDRSGIPVEATNDLQEVIGDLDVVYMNSIAFLGDSYRRLNARQHIDADTPLQPEAVVMHPLARGEELDPDLDRTDHNLYFAEAAGAVFVRQALLLALLGRIGTLAVANG